MSTERRWRLRVLDSIERVGNRLPDPITLFVILAAVVVVLSWFVSLAGVTATHPGTGEIIVPVNLLSTQGVRRMLTEMVRNFTTFPPLGLVIVVIIGVGVAERSGLVAGALHWFVKLVPPSMLGASLVFAGVMSSVAVDAGFVVLIPLGAMAFAAMGRHPLAGLAAALAGAAGGYSANLLLTPFDSVLAGLSTVAARLVDPGYEVQATANYYLMFASTFLITGLGAWVTSRFVEPRLGMWSPSPGAGLGPNVAEPSPLERRGLRSAGLAFLIGALVVALLALPAGGVLRNPDAADQDILVQLRPFFDSIAPIVMLLFLLIGLVYGVRTGSIRSDRDVARMASESVGVLGSYIVLAFAAAQFVAYFNWSNLGLILAIKGAGWLTAVGLKGVPLLLGFLLVAAIVDLFVASGTAKWAVMAPVFIPMLMLMGYSPEVTQAAYRVGDSTTNVITPLMPYLPLVIVFAKKYDNASGIGTLAALMFPYWIVFLIGWAALLTLWIWLGVPLGPGAGLTL